MDTRPSPRNEASRNDKDRITVRQTPAIAPPTPSMEPPPLVRRKVRNKSIRNTKDSAEMARGKLRQQSADRDGHSSAADVASHGTVFLRHERAQEDPTADHALALRPKPVANPYPRANQPPPTPPDTSDAHGVRPAFYWHDGLHESAAALVLHDGQDGHARQRRRSSFDSAYSHRSPDRTSRRRSPSLEFFSKPFQFQESPSHTLSIPLLEIPIPDYRLGSPRFSARGTAFLHNSIYSPFSSNSNLSRLSATVQPDRLLAIPPPTHNNSIDLRRSPSLSWFSPCVSPAVETVGGRLRPAPLALPPLELEHDGLPSPVYDKVAADPDNTAWVEYIHGTKNIVAATPTRLIAEITSPHFLDYDLLSDFFLTYRAFLSPSDLAKYLVSRLRWAVSQTHQAGRVVRVRTFVALRHWILNYFGQDFEPDHDLRVLFCRLVNKLASDLARRPGGGGGDLQVLVELQKCWNRTCAMVWGSFDTPQTYKSSETAADGEEQSLIPTARSIMGTSQMRNSSYMGSVSPQTTRNDISSRSSDTSIHANSCSFPRLKRPKPELKVDTQKPIPQRSRGPFHRHKRSDSFSDALRDARPTRPDLSETIAQPPAPPGRIIRGLVIHPSSASVVGSGPPSPPFLVRPADIHPSLSETLLRSDIPSPHNRSKLFGSMRRALSTRSKSSSPSRPKPSLTGDLRTTKDIEPQPRDMIRQMHARKAQGVHTDALAAMVMRSWEQQGKTNPQDSGQDSLRASFARNRSRTIHTDLPGRPRVDRLDSNLTSSSRSILIVDDTGIDDSLRTPTTVRSGNSLDGHLQRQTTEEAAVHDMALNNTAFLVPNNHISVEQSSRKNAIGLPRLSSAPTLLSISSAHHSPPPRAPLPHLPDSLFTPLGGNALVGDYTPSPHSEGMSSFGTAGLESPQQSAGASRPGSFRKSSLVDPGDLPGPIRPLRRRPGGDLRAVGTAQNHGFFLRRQSTGSITSRRSIMSSAEENDAQIHSRKSRPRLRARSTDGYAVDSGRNSSIRLLSTHSSQRQLRPSMEADVARLRALSQSEDDGGVELALSKLEGRYIPSRGSDITVKSFHFGDDDSEFPALTRQTNGTEVEILNQGDQPSSENSEPAASAVQKISESPLIGGDVHRFAHRRQQALDLAVVDPSDKPALPGHQRNVSSIATRDFARDLHEEPLRAVTPQQVNRPISPATPASTFLLDDGESLADRNSILARRLEPQSVTTGDHTFFLDVEEGEADADSTDYYQPPAAQHPLTPPTTADNFSDHGFDEFKVQLLYPGPLSAKPRKSFRLSELLLSEQFAKKAEHSALPRARDLPTQHTPFVLAHSSEALALQFTLIEKDALDSVGWTDLINLNWSQQVPSVRDWAQYVHSFPTNVTNVSSIDLIISRFNLVIKWCISSILLCGTPEERAQCITKFIHIATYSRRTLRNFATTAQLTIALLSSNLSRLASTWILVGPAEKVALKGLERLVSPVRNFAVLRSEMESAAAGLTDKDLSAGKGVIPFLGVYTRDLALNAQKPAFITPSDQTSAEASQEKLVNFERHRTTASIVKGVLRLLDASSRYIIVPDSEVLAKCLWLAALADSEIIELSRGLER